MSWPSKFLFTPCNVEVSSFSLQDSLIDPYFQGILNGIYKSYGSQCVPKGSLELISEENQIKVVCHPCSTGHHRHTILAGAKAKALSNLKAHLTRTSHTTAAGRWLWAKTAKTESDGDQTGENVTTEMARVEKALPGAYRLVYNKGSKVTLAKICCHICSKLLSLFPERGEVCQNAEVHANVHIKENKHVPNKRKQASLVEFVQISKREKKAETSPL